MISEAEKFKEEDELHQKRIESKNKLEGLMFQIRDSINNENIKSKFSEDELSSIQSSLSDLENWMNDTESEKTFEDYESKYKEFNDLITPYMEKLQSGDPTQGMDPSSMGGFDPSSMDPEKMKEMMEKMGMDPSQMGGGMEPSQTEKNDVPTIDEVD